MNVRRLCLPTLFLFAATLLVMGAAPAEASIECSQCDCSSSCSESCYFIIRGPCYNDPEPWCEERTVYSTCSSFTCTTSSGCGAPTCSNLTCTNTIHGDGNNNTLNGTANRECIYGYGGNDTIDGYAGDDRLYGGDGTDTLYGDSGNDCLWGEGGNDHLDGESGDDFCDGGTGTDSAANCETVINVP